MFILGVLQEHFPEIFMTFVVVYFQQLRVTSYKHNSQRIFLKNAEQQLPKNIVILEQTSHNSHILF